MYTIILTNNGKTTYSSIEDFCMEIGLTLKVTVAKIVIHNKNVIILTFIRIISIIQLNKFLIYLKSSTIYQENNKLQPILSKKSYIPFLIS